MGNVFADDDFDQLRNHKEDKAAHGTPAQRHNPDAQIRSSFKTTNISTGMEERAVKPVRPRRS